MPITLEANLKDIRVTGGTSGSPVMWEDIVAADASGGWGRITTLNAVVPRQYLVATDTRIFVGNNGTTPTYVAVERCQITFTNGYFQVQSGADVTKAVLRVGRQNSPAYYSASLTMRGLTTDGYVRLAGSGTLLMYWSELFLIAPLPTYSMTAVIENSMIGGSEWWGGKNVTMTDSIVNKVMSYTSPANPTFNISRTTLDWFNTYGAPLVSLRDMRMNIFWSCNAAATPVARMYDVAYTTLFNFDSTGAQFPINYEYSTMGMTVLDGGGAAVSGAAVVMRDVGGTTVYSGTTDGAGRIPEQDVLFRTRTLLGGSATSDVAATPHTVTITAAGYLERVLTLDMSTKHIEIEVLEPLPDFPAVGDVRLATGYDGGALVGTLALPGAGNTRSGVGYGAGGTELTGTLAVPVAVDVRHGVGYGAGGSELTGTLALPTAAQVLDGVGYGAGGSELTGNVTLPATGDVEAAVQYGAGGALTGTLAVPAAVDVRHGVGYGANGTEHTGAFSPTVVVGEGLSVSVVEDALSVEVED